MVTPVRNVVLKWSVAAASLCSTQKTNKKINYHERTKVGNGFVVNQNHSAVEGNLEEVAQNHSLLPLQSLDQNHSGLLAELLEGH